MLVAQFVTTDRLDRRKTASGSTARGAWRRREKVEISIFYTFISFTHEKEKSLLIPKTFFFLASSFTARLIWASLLSFSPSVNLSTSSLFPSPPRIHFVFIILYLFYYYNPQMIQWISKWRFSIFLFNSPLWGFTLRCGRSREDSGKNTEKTQLQVIVCVNKTRCAGTSSHTLPKLGQRKLHKFAYPNLWEGNYTGPAIRIRLLKTFQSSLTVRQNDEIRNGMETWD